MKRSVIENSLYYKRTSHKFDIDGDWLIACTITDDIPYNGDRASKDWFRESMSKVFRISHEPTFTGLVGIEVKWDDVEKWSATAGDKAEPHARANGPKREQQNGSWFCSAFDFGCCGRTRKSSLTDMYDIVYRSKRRTASPIHTS